MSDEKNRMEEASAHDREARHPFALGVLTGTVVGVGVGLLFAPRVGAQMRNEIGHQWTRAKGSCSTSYHRAKDTASQWSERGRRAYDATRTKVVHGAHETRQYVREVSDAVTRKAHRKADAAANVEFATTSR